MIKPFAKQIGTLLLTALLVGACGCPKDAPPPPPPPGPPTADFSSAPATGAAPLAVTFTDLSTPSGTITSWSWDFGDAGTSTEQNPVHNYGADGVYTVSLTVDSPSGTDTKTETACVMVGDITAEFTATPTVGQGLHTVRFTDQSTSFDTLTAWAWDFGDLNTSTDQDPTHVYSAAGTYTVSLTITTATGGWNTETKTDLVTVHAGKATGGSGGATGATSGMYNGRAYRLYVSASYTDSTPTPLVVAMHGLGDSPTNFYNGVMLTGWGTAADTHGFLLMVPDHKNPNRDSFLHITGSSTLDVPATTGEMRDLLDGIYYGVGASYNVETTKIFWIGFSEGASFSDFSAYILNQELRAVSPYAGAVGGKSLPVTRKIPVWAICGTSDPIMWPSVSTSHQEWIDASHPENHDWVAGVGHSFLTLCSQGPAPDSVYQWMAEVICEPVVSGLP